jgi:hypothetical protein
MNLSFNWVATSWKNPLLARARQKPQGESVGKAYIDLRARNSVKHLADRVEKTAQILSIAVFGSVPNGFATRRAKL